MLPQDGTGGWMPKPRYESPDSARITPATSIIAITIISGRTFGKMCRRMIRPGEAPMTLAAVTKSRSRSEKVCPRAWLVTKVQPSAPMNIARLM